MIFYTKTNVKLMPLYHTLIFFNLINKSNYLKHVTYTDLSNHWNAEYLNHLLINFLAFEKKIFSCPMSACELKTIK